MEKGCGARPAPPPAPKRPTPVRSDASEASLRAARASNLRFDAKAEYVVFCCSAGHDTRARRLFYSANVHKL